jgi:hypothetical protein
MGRQVGWGVRLTFEPAVPEWTLNAQCAIVPNLSVPEPPLSSLHISFGSGAAACFRTLTGLEVGESYPVSARVNFDGDGSGEAQLRMEYNDSPSQFSATIVKDPDVPGWHIRQLGLLHYTFPDRVFRINGLPLVGGLSTVELHAILIGEEPQEALMARSTALSFMSKLQGLIEGIDPNIGRVYATPKRWPTIERLENEGTLRINTAGLLDEATRIGLDVTRFWWMRPRIDCQPLTNGSAEYITTVELVGFYQHEDGDAQFTALNQAAIEILDAINTKDAELNVLNTGDAYLGYLLARPRMDPVQHAQLESPKVVGNSVQITISFAEEVSYA